jgi:endonuclease/exonuclease/phosphatase family metal-dependent hydrolase
MNLGRKMVEFLMIAANLLVVLLMVTAMIASKLSPAEFLLPAYTTLLLPFIIIFNIAFIIFWIIFKKWYFLLSLVILIAGASLVQSTFVFNPGKKEIILNPDSVFTLMSYNTHANDMMAKHSSKKPNKLIKYMLDSDPDVLCIQEFSAAKSNDNLTKADLSRAFSKYPYRYNYYKIFTGWSYFGIATFSKYPILKMKAIEYPSDVNVSIYTDLLIKGDTIRLFNCHLESNKLTENDKTMALKLRENLNTDNIRGTTAHLSKKLGSAYRLRALQADMVAGEIASSPYPVMVAGDFNDVAGSYAYTKVRGDLHDAFVQNGFGLGWTYNESVFHFRIDHILFDDNFQLNDIRIDTHFKGSDHYPLISKFTIRKQSN